MKNTTNTTIIQSLLWAAAMIAAAIILRGTEYADKIYYILFTLWLGSYVTLQINRESLQSEWNCIRKFLRLTPKTD